VKPRDFSAQPRSKEPRIEARIGRDPIRRLPASLFTVYKQSRHEITPRRRLYGPIAPAEFQGVKSLVRKMKVGDPCRRRLGTRKCGDEFNKLRGLISFDIARAAIHAAV